VREDLLDQRLSQNRRDDLQPAAALWANSMSISKTRFSSFARLSRTGR